MEKNKFPNNLTCFTRLEVNIVIMSEKSQWIIKIISINVARMASAFKDLINNPKFISLFEF